MLLTDVWGLLEHMDYEPPAHILLQWVAPTFGYKPPQQTKSRKPTKRDIKAARKHNARVNLAEFGGIKKLSQMPSWVMSPTMKKIIEEQKKMG